MDPGEMGHIRDIIFFVTHLLFMGKFYNFYFMVILKKRKEIC